MLRVMFLGLSAAAFAAIPAWADPNPCGMCHSPAEFEGVALEEIREALADPGIPPHGKFAGMSEEELEALLESLKE
jgi:hypothetical protein